MVVRVVTANERMVSEKIIKEELSRIPGRKIPTRTLLSHAYYMTSGKKPLLLITRTKTILGHHNNENFIP